MNERASGPADLAVSGDTLDDPGSVSSATPTGWQSMNSNRVAVSAELNFGLVGPENTIVPLMASLHYTCEDPYAVKMAFHVGTDEPVEWVLARDLLAAALLAREGIGDVQAWPTAATGGPAEDGTADWSGILNIVMTSPFGHAQFEAPSAAVAGFLDRTFQLVPAGQESTFMDFDDELTEFLSQS
jgi:sporulation and cell division protein SsgA